MDKSPLLFLMLIICVALCAGCITGEDAGQGCEPCTAPTDYTILETSEIDRQTIESLQAQLNQVRQDALLPDGEVAIVRLYGSLGEEDVGTMYEILGALGDDANVGAVVLWIDSPGGGTGATVDIYHALAALRARKPVVAYSGEMIASGGYYLSLGADAIVASPECLVGNIGVIYVHTDATNYYRDFGLDLTVIKTGAHKDMGADWRALTPDEYSWLESNILEAFNRFVHVVALERGMTNEEALTMSDGRIWSAADALAEGMIDRVGTLETALTMAEELAGLEKADVQFIEVWDEGSVKTGGYYTPLRYQWEETIKP